MALNLQGLISLLTGNNQGQIAEEDRRFNQGIELADAALRQAMGNEQIAGMKQGREQSAEKRKREKEVLEPREDMLFEQSQNFMKASAVNGVLADFEDKVGTGKIKYDEKVHNQLYDAKRQFIQAATGVVLPSKTPPLTYVPDAATLNQIKEFYQRSPIDTNDAAAVQKNADLWNLPTDLIKVIGNPGLTPKEQMDAAIEDQKNKTEVMKNAWNEVSKLVGQKAFLGLDAPGQQQTIATTLAGMGLVPEVAVQLASNFPHFVDKPDATVLAQIQAQWNQQTRDLNSKAAIATLEARTRMEAAKMGAQATVQAAQIGATSRENVANIAGQYDVAAAQSRAAGGGANGQLTAPQRVQMRQDLVGIDSALVGRNPSINPADPATRTNLMNQKAEIIAALNPEVIDPQRALAIVQADPQTANWGQVKKLLKQAGADDAALQFVYKEFGYSVKGAKF